MQFNKKIRSKKKPETAAGEKWTNFVRHRGWFIVKLHGNEYQSGLPDYFMAHPDWGSRWVEMKMPDGQLEASQIEMFKRMHAHGVPIYMVRGIEDYDLLFKPANYLQYLQLGNACFSRPKGS